MDGWRVQKERWEDLARARIVFSRPALDLDEASARRMLDPRGLLGSVEGKSVLCLAGGGGQQSAAFGLLGARVTVFDISETRWDVEDEAGNCRMLEGPREFRHTLGTLVNGLIENGFIITGLWEDVAENADAAPGTWEHFKLIAPPGFSLWGRYRPDALRAA